MKLSIFTTVTKPRNRGDNYIDAFACYGELADEVIVMNGSPDSGFMPSLKHSQFKYVDHEWPRDFSWEFIGQQFQRGYEAATGDWVIHCDLDYIFHQKDFAKIRQALRDYPNAPAVSFYKWQFILPDRYNLKARLVIAVNKAKFGDRIKFDSGGDLCQPSLDGKELRLDEMPQAGVPFYNYEKLTKTKKQIINDIERMDNAYLERFEKTLYSTDEITAYEGWYRMMAGRFTKPSKAIPLSDHPKYVQETIKNLTPEQFGYNGFGLIEGKIYD